MTTHFYKPLKTLPAHKLETQTHKEPAIIKRKELLKKIMHKINKFMSEKENKPQHQSQQQFQRLEGAEKPEWAQWSGHRLWDKASDWELQK